MVDQPLVTIIALCYNTGNYVLEALECVRNQTYKNIELLIFDDHSTDDSASKIEKWISETKYDCQFICNEKNLGIPGVFNTAFKIAKGEFVTWIADDTWKNNRLEEMVAVFVRQQKNVGVLFGNAIITNSSGEQTGYLSIKNTLQLLKHPSLEILNINPGEAVVLPASFIHEALYWKCFIPAPSVMVRKSIFQAVGNYDETIPIEDLDYWFRVSRQFDFVFYNTDLVNYRVHSEGFTSGKSETYLAALNATLKKNSVADKHLSSAIQAKRHIREESYRVITGLLKAKNKKPAKLYFKKYYLPNKDWSSNSVKETLRLYFLFFTSFFS